MDDKKKLSIVVFSGELDKALAAFIISSGAAAMGLEVSLFFTFWGLNIIKKNKGKLIKGKGIMEKMLNMMNRGGTNKLPLSNLDMLGMGRAMMKKMMKKKNVSSLDELIEMAKQMNVKMFICEMSCDLMGLKKEDFIDGVIMDVGVATYLDDATDSAINLFI